MADLSRIKTFAINVKSNEFRKDHILAQSEVAGLDIQIFEAITPDTIDTVPHQYNAKKARNFTGRALFDTEIACGLSHIALWWQLDSDPDADYYVILEDDVEISDNIGAILSSMDLGSVDLLKFSGQCTRPMKKIRTLSDTHTLYRYAFGPLDAAAYLISKKAASRMAEYCQHLFAPIDVMMDRSYDHGVPIYGVHPYAAKTQFCFDENDPLYTDIGVRDRKYAPDITVIEKMACKYHRLTGSVRRHFATLCLYICGGRYV